jgi:ribosomal protein S18 acetylase RimI-like enzyme
MIRIRPIRETDIPAFREALDSVCRERRFLAALEAPPLESTRAFVANNVRRDLPQVVALDGEKLVGWCDALPGDPADGAARIGRLGMGVVKAYRGRGLGRRLLEATIAKARTLDLEKIELCVYGSNTPALALYRKFRFEEVARKERGRCVDGIYDDIISMALDLRPPNPLPPRQKNV